MPAKTTKANGNNDLKHLTHHEHRSMVMWSIIVAIICSIVASTVLWYFIDFRLTTIEKNQQQLQTQYDSIFLYE